MIKQELNVLRKLLLIQKILNLFHFCLNFFKAVMSQWMANDVVNWMMFWTSVQFFILHWILIDLNSSKNEVNYFFDWYKSKYGMVQQNNDPITLSSINEPSIIFYSIHVYQFFFLKILISYSHFVYSKIMRLWTEFLKNLI